MYKPNKLFLNNGHDCKLLKDLDIVYNLEPRNFWYGAVIRWFIRLFTISELHPYTVKYMHGQFEVNKSKMVHLQLKCIIHPFSKFRQIWDCYFCIIHAIAIFTIPTSIVGVLVIPERTIKELHARVIQIATLKFVFFGLSFLLNILISLFSGYYDKKRKIIVFDRSKIIVQCLRTYFLPDLILGVQPYFWYNFFATYNHEHYMFYNLMACTQLIIIVCIRRIIELLRCFMLSFHISTTIQMVVQVAFYACVYIQWYGTVILLILKLQASYIEAYIKMEGADYGLEYSTLFELWITTLYHCLVVITGAGTGVFHVTSKFAFFQIVLWITTRILLHVLIAKVVMLTMGSMCTSLKNYNMMLQLRVYMRDKNLSRQLKNRLYVYYEYRFSKSFFNEAEIMRTANRQLRQDMTTHRCQKLLEKVSFFKGLPIAFLLRLINCLEPAYYLINDVIIKADTEANILYFISSGTVAIYATSGTEICHLYDGNHFGEIALIFPNLSRSASVVAVESCKLFCLSRKDFLMAVTPFPDLLGQIETIAMQRLENTRYASQSTKN